MITKNYRQYLKRLPIGKGNQAGVTTVTLCGTISVKNTSGDTRYLGGSTVAGSNDFPMRDIHTYYRDSYNGFWFGRGTTTPTEDDYELEDRITEDVFTVSVLSTSEMIDENDNPCVQYVYTVTNKSTSNITIGEIGFYGRCNCSTSLGSNTITSDKFLLEREVFPNGILIEPQEVKKIVYTVKLV